MAQVRSSCKKVPLEENLSSDKQIISFKGRISLKTYNSKKSHKWEYKMWVLLDVSDLSYNFEIANNQISFEKIPGELNLDTASNIVMRMCKIIPKNVNHKVFF